MNRTQLTDAVAARCGLSRAAVGRVLDALEESVIEALAKGETARVGRLGTLRAGRSAERVVRSVRDGRRTPVASRTTVRFRASEPLLRRLTTPDDMLFRDPAQVAAWRVAEALVSDVLAYHKGGEAMPAAAFAEGTEPAAFDAAAHARFGAAWARARGRYEEEVPAAVRSRRDHLRHALARHVLPG